VHLSAYYFSLKPEYHCGFATIRAIFASRSLACLN